MHSASFAGPHRDPAGYHAAAVVGVILVHLPLLAFLLHSGPTIVAAPVQTVRETILTLIPNRPQTVTHKAALAPHTPTRTKSSSSAPKPSWVFPLPPNRPTAPIDLNGLATGLFNCGPENIGNLSREARSGCVNASNLADYKSQPLGVVRVRSQDGALWAAGIAQRNTPVRVPCVGLSNQVTNGISGTSKVKIDVDMICAAGLALHARDLLRKTHLSD